MGALIMNIPLSNRLKACCELVRQGDRVADIGCDHGYLGIHLLRENIAASVIAADINEGPLQSAIQNAGKFGVKDRMTFYLSDGVNSIPKDFDTLVCAGMGADTMISILESAPWLKNAKYRLILQCQSRRPALRKYLYEQGFCIRKETLAKDGRFIYPITEVIYTPSPALSPAQYHITPALLKSGSELLPAFYQMVVDGLVVSVKGLSRTGGEKYEQYKAVLQELKELEERIYGNRC